MTQQVDPSRGAAPPATPRPGKAFRRALTPPALVSLGLLTILPGLGARDVVNSHEARVVQTARTMAAAGWPWAAEPVDVPAVELATVGKIKRLRPRADGATLSVNPWLVPVMNRAIRLQKPPLPYWAAAVSIKLLGDTEAAARLPGALLSALSTALVFGLGRRAFGRRVGWYAGLAWASLYFVYDEHRKAMADPYLAFFALAAVWAWGRAGIAKRWWGGGVAGWRGVGRSAVVDLLHHPTPPPRHLLLFYLLLGVGTLAKGPVVLLHVGAGVTAWHLCVGGRRSRGWRPPGRWWQHAVGLAMFLAAALPWSAYVLGHVPNAIELWRYESVGEFADNTEKARPALFYLPELFLIALPWSAVWAAHAVGSAGRWWFGGAGPPARGRLRRRELFPVVWLAGVVTVLSVAHVKKNAYLLPVAPAIALSVGCGLRHLTAARRLRGEREWSSDAQDLDRPSVPQQRSSPFRRAVPWLVAGHVLVAAVFAATLPALAAWAQAPTDQPSSSSPGLPFSPSARAAVVGLLAGGAVAGLLAVAARRRSGRAWPMAQSVVFAALTASLFVAVGAPLDNRRSAKAACAEAVRLLAEGGRTIATNKLSEEVAVYLPVDPYAAVHPDSRFAAKVLLVWDDADGVAARRGRLPVKPFDPTGWQVEGGRATAFRRVSVPANAGDVRWKLYELTVDRMLVATR